MALVGSGCLCGVSETALILRLECGAKNLSRSETLVHFSAKRIFVRTELRFPATLLVAKLLRHLLVDATTTWKRSWSLMLHALSTVSALAKKQLLRLEAREIFSFPSCVSSL